MIKCPNCGVSHYSTGPSIRTSMYYPPVWKDGVNINPDMNKTITDAHCCNCNYDFKIIEQGGKTWVELGKHNPPTTPIDLNITAPANNTATIKLEKNEGTRIRYIWEDEIDELKETICKLQEEIHELAREVYKLQ